MCLYFFSQYITIPLFYFIYIYYCNWNKLDYISKHTTNYIKSVLFLLVLPSLMSRSRLGSKQNIHYNCSLFTLAAIKASLEHFPANNSLNALWRKFCLPITFSHTFVHTQAHTKNRHICIQDGKVLKEREKSPAAI